MKRVMNEVHVEEELIGLDLIESNVVSNEKKINVEASMELRFT